MSPRANTDVYKRQAHSMPALEGAMAGIYGDQYLVQMGLLAAILVPSPVSYTHLDVYKRQAS